MTPEIHARAAIADDREAYLRLAARHYENFPVGSWLLPRAARRHLHRIYAFARTADDLADEWRDARALADFGDALRAHLAGTPERHVPLFDDLVETIRERELPPELFFDLLDAFAQDLRVGRYADEAALLDYCRRSANPIGRLVLRVCGVGAGASGDGAVERRADAVCTGLQLLNHLQDLGEDYRERDRIYFPQTDLERFGVDGAMLGAGRAAPPVRALARHWDRRITELLRAGWPLLEALRGRLRLEIRAVLCGAAAVLTAIRAAEHDVLGVHVRLGRRQRAAVLWRALLRPDPPAAFR